MKFRTTRPSSKPEKSEKLKQEKPKKILYLVEDPLEKQLLQNSLQNQLSKSNSRFFQSPEVQQARSSSSSSHHRMRSDIVEEYKEYEQRIASFLNSRDQRNHVSQFNLAPEQAKQPAKSKSQLEFHSQRLETATIKRPTQNSSNKKEQRQQSRSPDYQHIYQCPACSKNLEERQRSVKTLNRDRSRDRSKSPQLDSSSNFSRLIEEQQEQIRDRDIIIQKQKDKIQSLREEQNRYDEALKDVLMQIAQQFEVISDDQSNYINFQQKILEVLIKGSGQKDMSFKQQAQLELANQLLAINLKFSQNLQHFHDALNRIGGPVTFESLQAKQKKQEEALQQQQLQIQQQQAQALKITANDEQLKLKIEFEEIQRELNSERTRNGILQSQIDLFTKKEQELMEQVEALANKPQLSQSDGLRQQDEEESKANKDSYRDKDGQREKRSLKPQYDRWGNVYKMIRRKEFGSKSPMQNEKSLEQQDFLQKQIDKLKKENANQEKVIKQQQTTIEKLNKEMKSLNEIIQEQRIFTKQQQSEIESLKKKIPRKTIQKEAESPKPIIKSTPAQPIQPIIIPDSQAPQELEDKNKQLTQELYELRDEQEKLTEIVKQQYNYIHQLEAEQQDTKRLLEDQELQIHRLKEDSQSARQIEDLKQENQILSQRNEQLQNQFDLINTEMSENLQSVSSEREKQIAITKQYEEQITQMKNTNQQLLKDMQNHVKKQQEDCNRLNEQLVRSQEEFKKINNQLSSAQDENKRLNEQLKQKNEDLQKAQNEKGQASQTVNEVQGLKQQLEQKDLKLKDYEKQIVQLSHQNQQQQAGLQKVEQEKKDKNQQIEELTQQIDKLKLQLTEQEVQNGHMQQRLEESNDKILENQQKLVQVQKLNQEFIDQIEQGKNQLISKQNEQAENLKQIQELKQQLAQSDPKSSPRFKELQTQNQKSQEQLVEYEKKNKQLQNTNNLLNYTIGQLEQENQQQKQQLENLQKNRDQLVEQLQQDALAFQQRLKQLEEQLTSEKGTDTEEVDKLRSDNKQLIKDLQKEIAQVNHSENELKQVREQLRQSQHEVEAFKSQVEKRQQEQSAPEIIHDNQKELEDLQAKNRQYHDQIVKLQQEIENLKKNPVKEKEIMELRTLNNKLQDSKKELNQKNKELSDQIKSLEKKLAESSAGKDALSDQQEKITQLTLKDQQNVEKINQMTSQIEALERAANNQVKQDISSVQQETQTDTPPMEQNEIEQKLQSEIKDLQAKLEAQNKLQAPVPQNQKPRGSADAAMMGDPYKEAQLQQRLREMEDKYRILKEKYDRETIDHNTYKKETNALIEQLKAEQNPQV